MFRCSCALLLLQFIVTSSAWAQQPRIALEPFVRGGLERPVYVTHDGTDRIFIVEQPGRVRLVINGEMLKTPYLDVARSVADGGECGFLSIAFHPDFATNGYLYANYTARRPKLMTVISEFRADPRAQTVDPTTERILLTIDQPYGNHNGGQIKFGPDGMLYIGMGDGGSANDPKNSGQDPASLLGKMLRIDVDQRNPYGIPKDNPMVNQRGVRSEIWAGGLRNPWRFSFDRETGLCYAGDVGQNHWEEISIITKGGNYGWRPREGSHPTPAFRNKEQVQGEYIDPIVEYGRDMGMSVTGGYVYRGDAIPDLVGWYLYADYASGRVWGLRYENGKVLTNVELMKENMSMSSFGEDKAGELYLCDHSRGNVWRFVAGR
jgi:glucose/arabinose dehydrogenase